MRILTRTYLPLLQRTDVSASAKEKGASLGLFVLRRDQNRPGTLPVRLALRGVFFLHFSLGGVRHGIGGGRPDLSLSLCVERRVPRFPISTPQQLVDVDVS